MVKNILITLFFLTALYFGSGGFIHLENEQRYNEAIALEEKKVNYNGITFHNKEVAEVAQQQSLAETVYPYAKNIPAALSFIITAVAFGIIGSIAKIVNDSIKNKTDFKDTPNLLLIPIQGANIGLIILGLSYTIPTVLTSDEVSLKPISVVFFSLFGGIFHKDFYRWLTQSVNKFIKNNSE